MLRKEFKTWPTDFILNAILLKYSMHIINLGDLENGLFCFTKLPNSGTEESNKILGGLDNDATISENNNKH